jgi:hypothetical protein
MRTVPCFSKEVLMALDNLAGVLFTAVAAVCPIQGVAIGDPADKALGASTST